MPRLTNSANTVAIFARFAYLYNAVYYAHYQDVKLFVNITAPVLGEYILDLGTGST